MGAISQVEMSAVNSTYDTAQTQKTETKKAQIAAKTGWADSSVKTNTDYGKTIGEPELSDKAREYYEKLKSKFGNLDFILVSKDMKDIAKAQAARYANPSKMVVLIDEEKIERMATDEAYREKYEAIIANGSNQLSQIASQLGAASSGVKAFGMQVEDNRASFFAAVDKSFAQQRERIAERREEKKAEKKAAEKKAEKKEKQEAIEEKREAAREEKAEKAEKVQGKEWDDTISITSDSADGLVKQIQNLYYEWMTNNVQTDAEKLVGQNLDLQV